MKTNLNKKLLSWGLPLLALTAVASLSFFSSSTILAKPGWQTESPPDVVKIRSAQPNHVFYQGQPLAFEFDGAAVRFVVRDYWGEVVEEGDADRLAGGRLRLAARAPGWYKLYLHGAQTRAPWGDIVGSTTFCVFRDDARFPKGNSLAAAADGTLANLGTLKVSTTAREVDFDWKEGAPEGVRADNFRARWSGWVKPEASGTYTFTTLADDGVRLWVGGKKIIDDWKERVPTENSGQANLVAGQLTPIRLEYFEKGFGASARLSWSRGGQAPQVMPASVLFQDAKGTQPGLKAAYFESSGSAEAEEGGGGEGTSTYSPSMNPLMRNVTGMGPQRHFVEDASKPEEAIRKLEGAIEQDKKQYLAFDPLRKRALLIAFPNGTQDLAGVKRIVERFKDDVRYWEPRNEPNFGMSGAQFAQREAKPFYDAVKSVDPALQVLGPGTVTIGPGSHGLPWIDEFLGAGGAKCIDAFSFHAYNNVNGDLTLARQSMDALQKILEKHGIGDIEKWQTEQGYFAAMYGAYLPRHQGHWTMVQMMVYEQYGIPKEHNHYWYDKSHGFWDFPTWWENDDGGLNPAAPLLRVWSEQLYDTNFARAYNFGTPGNRFYIGSLFQGPGKSVAAFMSAGDPNGKINLRVRGGTSLRVVSSFGVAKSLPVRNEQATLEVPNLPVYVEMAPGQSIEVVPLNWGRNLARQPGVRARADGSKAHPQEAKAPNDIGKLFNGVLDNWYWMQSPEEQPWLSNVSRFPAAVEIILPARASVGRVAIYAAPPWQLQSTLLDYELQWDDGGQWKTIERVREPARTFPVWTPATRTSVDSFFSGRWIFTHQFAPVTTQKLRLLVHNVTWGGGATKDVVDAGGQAGLKQIMLREVEIYPAPTPAN
jgi:hypothetical protein